MTKDLQIFEKDTDKVILGDIIEALSTVANESVDLIFADPPYS